MVVVFGEEGRPVFFFFKQKTAYEMRISDGSSDVCSSDLHVFERAARRFDALVAADCLRGAGNSQVRGRVLVLPAPHDRLLPAQRELAVRTGADAQVITEAPVVEAVRALHARPRVRSEEHTSELQSLMRISYAAFCLKKTKHQNKQP